MARLNPKAYDTLVRVRKTQEDLRAQHLATARREVQAATAQRNEIEREQVRMLEEAGARLRDQFDASDVRRFYQHERHLAQLGVEKDIEIRELEAAAEKRRQELEAASKRRRVVERLQERKRAAYIKHVNKLEQQQLDETAAAYAARRIVAAAQTRAHREHER
jgi:flagellar export protein FliJ